MTRWTLTRRRLVNVAGDRLTAGTRRRLPAEEGEPERMELSRSTAASRRTEEISRRSQGSAGARRRRASAESERDHRRQDDRKEDGDHKVVWELAANTRIVWALLAGARKAWRRRHPRRRRRPELGKAGLDVAAVVAGANGGPGRASGYEAEQKVLSPRREVDGGGVASEEVFSAVVLVPLQRKRKGARLAEEEGRGDGVEEGLASVAAFDHEKGVEGGAGSCTGREERGGAHG